nr:hypothetical protein [Tanacetum cinerariifolium]
MTSITSLCEMACQVVQKKLEEKQTEEERAAKAKYWKLPVCCDDDDDEERSDSLDDNIIFGLPPFSVITPDEPILSTEEPDNSLSMGDEHLDTIPATESDEFIKSSVENLIPIPSESEGIPEHVSWDRVFKIKDAFGNEQYKPEDVQELFHKLLNDVQNIHEELAEYINTPGWNLPTFYNNSDDDDVDYTIAITPVLSTEEPNNSLSMRDKHLDTIPTTESDEVIKSSVEDLVSIPSEFKGIPDTMCDVHHVNNPTPLEAKDHFGIVINSNDDYSSSDDDSLYYENIEYVEASPHDSKFVSLEVENIVIPKDEEIEDDNLREKLLKVNILIAKMEALKDNPTPSSEFLTKSSSTSPKSFLE